MHEYINDPTKCEVQSFTPNWGLQLCVITDVKPEVYQFTGLQYQNFCYWGKNNNKNIEEQTAIIVTTSLWRTVQKLIFLTYFEAL